eukprot:gene8802-14837_t
MAAAVVPMSAAVVPMSAAVVPMSAAVVPMCAAVVPISAAAVPMAVKFLHGKRKESIYAGLEKAERRGKEIEDCKRRRDETLPATSLRLAELIVQSCLCYSDREGKICGINCFVS